MIKESDGIWTLDPSGGITKQPLPNVPLTREAIERLRLAAYAEPVSGSGRYFAEANRMQVMDEPGWEIQARHPWPEAAAPH
jgi:hypothetical protein